MSTLLSGPTSDGWKDWLTTKNRWVRHMISKENEKTGIQTDSSCEGTPYIGLQQRQTGITPWVFREGGGVKDQRQKQSVSVESLARTGEG